MKIVRPINTVAMVKNKLKMISHRKKKHFEFNTPLIIMQICKSANRDHHLTFLGSFYIPQVFI